MSEGTEGQWYYARSGQQQGPVSESALKDLLRAGQLSPGDMVWRQGMAQWSPAASVPALAAAAGPARVPPPVPAQMPQPYPPPGGYAPHPGYGAPAGTPLQYASPAPAYPQGGGIGQDPGVRWLLPVGRSIWAIAAGYLGLLSFVILPAPLALIVSIIAIIDIRKHPERHGMGRAIFGLIMGILGSVMFLFMLVAMMARSR